MNIKELKKEQERLETRIIFLEEELDYIHSYKDSFIKQDFFNRKARIHTEIRDIQNQLEFVKSRLKGSEKHGTEDNINHQQ